MVFECFTRLRFLAAAVVLAAAAVPAGAHPHEWVDWGAGLVLNEAKPVKVVALQLELTWDEWFSSLVLQDFPKLASGGLGAADLGQLDSVYGLGSAQRASSLTVLFQDKPVKFTRRVLPPKTNGKTVTLVYQLLLGLEVTKPSALKVSLYDPTYYTDMGIRAKNGAFYLGVKDPKAYEGSTSFEQDFAHPYYQGTVFPEAVVFALKP